MLHLLIRASVTTFGIFTRLLNKVVWLWTGPRWSGCYNRSFCCNMEQFLISMQWNVPQHSVTCLSVSNLLVVVQTLTGTISSVRRTWRRLWTSWPKGTWHQRRSPWYVIKPSRRLTSTETTSSPSPTSRTWSQRLQTSWGTTVVSNHPLCVFIHIFLYLVFLWILVFRNSQI